MRKEARTKAQTKARLIAAVDRILPVTEESQADAPDVVWLKSIRDRSTAMSTEELVEAGAHDVVMKILSTINYEFDSRHLAGDRDALIGESLRWAARGIDPIKAIAVSVLTLPGRMVDASEVDTLHSDHERALADDLRVLADDVRPDVVAAAERLTDRANSTGVDGEDAVWLRGIRDRFTAMSSDHLAKVVEPNVVMPIIDTVSREFASGNLTGDIHVVINDSLRWAARGVEPMKAIAVALLTLGGRRRDSTDN